MKCIEASPEAYCKSFGFFLNSNILTLSKSIANILIDRQGETIRSGCKLMY